MGTNASPGYISHSGSDHIQILLRSHSVVKITVYDCAFSLFRSQQKWTEMFHKQVPFPNAWLILSLGISSMTFNFLSVIIICPRYLLVCQRGFSPKEYTRDLAPKPKVLRCRHRHALQGGAWHIPGSLGGWLWSLLNWWLARVASMRGVKSKVSSSLNHGLLQRQRS